MTQFDQRSQQVDTQYNAEHITIQQRPLSLTEKQRKQNRTRMLDRVQAIWIDGVLEPSIQGAAQIALELHHKPSAVVTPLWHVLREFSKTGPLPPADASIVQVYDHANGEVLILGERYCHGRWWRIRSAPANAFSADFPLEWLYK